MRTILELAIPVVVILITIQVLLSKLKNNWAGLILPGLILLWSLISATQTFSENNIGDGIVALIFCNIPTLVLLFIYFVFYYKKKNKTSELEKMNIEDL